MTADPVDPFGTLGPMNPTRLLLLLALALVSGSQLFAKPGGGALAGHRHRVIVSSDIGGTDPDDFQSMVHFLLYADVFDVEGLISSPYGPGRREHILQVIDCYKRDYAGLKTYSQKYPPPDTLRAMTKQGALGTPGAVGFGKPTEGSEWIVRCARRQDPRPLWVMVWGGIEDLAQALHDAPDILPKLRVYFIGGPNKMWSVDAYNYIEQNHPNLWIIEANATYRGWFVGGNQAGEWGNSAFVDRHVAGRGALGEFFATQLKATIKMGDSPSVGFLLRGTSEDPSQPRWGGKFVRVWDARKTIFDRVTTEADQAEVFGVVEFALPIPAGMAPGQSARIVFDGRIPAVGARDGGVLRFRFSPRDAKVWPYVIQSDFPGLDGLSGKFRAVPPPAGRTSRPSAVHPNWWIDDPDPAAAEGVHPGAKHVSRWREEFLADFAERMRRCEEPKPAPTSPPSVLLPALEVGVPHFIPISSPGRLSIWSAAAEGVRRFIRTPGDAALAPPRSGRTGNIESVGAIHATTPRIFDIANAPAPRGSQSGVARSPDKASDSFCRRTPY